MMSMHHSLLLLVLIMYWKVSPSACEEDAWGTQLNIPIIDISPIMERENYSIEDALNCSRSIDDSFRKYGVFIAIGHSMNEVFKNKAIDTAKLLFSMSKTELNDVKFDVTRGMRGYLGFGQESGLLQKYFEAKEGFSYGYNFSTTAQFSNKMQVPNVWPNALLNHDRDTLSSVCFESSRIGKSIVRAVSLSLNGNSFALDSFIDKGDTISIMRLFHYFVVNQTDHSENQLGSSPHTDWGLLTVILQDDVGGLQFQYHGEWIDVPVVKNSAVINAGDFLRLLSRNNYHSPVHRVLSPTVRNRLSFVYFYYPNFETRIDESFVVKKSTNQTIEYNTLLFNDQINDSDHIEVFGDYIVKKWLGVNKQSQTSPLETETS